MTRRKSYRPALKSSTIQIEGATKQYLDIARSRLVLALALFMLGYLAIAGRVFDLTVFKKLDKSHVYARATSKESLPKGRADIVDRNGVLLATTLKTASLYVDPKTLLNPEEAIEKLSRLFPDMTKASLKEKLTSDKRFVWIKRHLTPREQFQVNALGIPGLNFQDDTRRIYPLGPLFAHVVGYTDIDNVGISGLEKYFDGNLHRQTQAMRIALDSKVQHAVRNELTTAIKKHQAVGGAGLVMDVNTGEIISMVSLPDFDPNNPTASPEATRFNRNTSGVYEMGSTFKIFNTAMALESGKVHLTDGFETKNPIKIAGGYLIKNYKPEGDWLTVPEIFVHSSNIGSAKMAVAAGTENQKSFLKKAGLLEPSAIELTEIGPPLYPKTWREVNTMTIAFGHGISVSPVQLATAVSAMVNGGTMRPATLLHSAANAKEGTRIISDQTSEVVRNLMRQVVLRGTGTKAEAAGYMVGGKTGSAEKVGGVGYNESSLLSSFIGVFPIQSPRYVVFVMIDEPKAASDTFGFATGGWVAAPAVSKIITRIAPMLGVMPVNEADPQLQRVINLDITAPQKEGHNLVSHTH